MEISLSSPLDVFNVLLGVTLRRARLMEFGVFVSDRLSGGSGTGNT